jgi:hypothetical protein
MWSIYFNSRGGTVPSSLKKENMNYENLNLPPIKDFEFAANFFVYYLRFREHVEIDEQYLGRKTTVEEIKSLLYEWMLDPSLKDKYGSGSRTAE